MQGRALCPTTDNDPTIDLSVEHYFRWPTGGHPAQGRQRDRKESFQKWFKVGVVVSDDKDCRMTLIYEIVRAIGVIFRRLSNKLIYELYKRLCEIYWWCPSCIAEHDEGHSWIVRETSHPSEIIQSGVDGFVTEYKNPKAMVDKINYLIEHPDVRKEMGKKARVNIQRFNIDEIMGRWIMLFHQLIG